MTEAFKESNHPALHYQDMLSDGRRMVRYRKAIEAVVRPGDVVVDLGTGLGVLAIMAAQSGAEHVYGVDVRPQIMSITERIIAANGLSGRISLIRSDAMDLESNLYATSREREMALLDHWSDAQKHDFLDQQFNAQRIHYRKYYPDAKFNIIERDGQPLGRLYVAELKQEIRLMDITLIPAARNAGIGGRISLDILARAERLGRIVSLHVEDGNPANRLYKRLGFVEVGEVSFYKLMHWSPQGLSHISRELSAQLNMAS